MPGGARNRSGPPPDPTSGRSDRRGLKFEALPAEGYRGDPPVFPLPGETVREAEVWTEAWRAPQAVAWAREPWRWSTVAMWVRVRVACESPECPSGLLGQLHRFADQIGMTPAGMRDNGWTIAHDVATERRASPPPKPGRSSVKSRLRVVADAAGQ